ncbi:cobyrinate a,c-diamide synthase [Desulfovibrio sp. ZJ200]|uniref:cobyrinate a,c-diamide synthase n=1 Tax=Desulfovibrio sp. ZJ200 TaxID=2709792 RepID=UPI0013EB76F7|nr:cobyrinate a,c-diamide synthase [Desulfovibrio sp. ZJ200]
MDNPCCAPSPLPASVNVPRLCVSALSGGGGKTLLSLGLARALAGMGVAVKPFKKGPDYIDAAWLSLAAQCPATNLDPYFLPPPRLRALFAHAVSAVAPARAARQTGADGAALPLALVEGNRGLFDGLDAAGSCSTAELARILACPILLSLDCTKMTRTAAALVQGMLHFEPGLSFCGVVLNQLGSSRHESAVRRALEQYTDLPVLGAVPRLPENPLPERHMGIACRGETLAEDAGRILDSLADLARAHVDLAAVLAAARAAPPLPVEGPFWPGQEAGAVASLQVARPHNESSALTSAAATAAQTSRHAVAAATAGPRIGYVRDAALWFYYQENLEALSRAGAELLCLSLLDHGAPWPELDGLYLGGGFPEDSAPELSRSRHLTALRGLANAGAPVYAECGGFMLLAQGIEREGRLWPMSGVFPVTACFCPKPQGLGYVRGRVARENPYFPQGLEVRGHEFHYSRCHWSGEAPLCALDLERGKGMGQMAGRCRDALIHKRVWAGYTHIFAPATPCWAHNFVLAARRFREEQAAARGGSRLE